MTYLFYQQYSDNFLHLSRLLGSVWLNIMSKGLYDVIPLVRQFFRNHASLFPNIY